MKENLEFRAPNWFFRIGVEMPLWKRIVWRLFGEKRVGSDVTEYGRTYVVGYKFRGITLITETRFLDWE